MSGVAYVDTSAILAVALNESGARAMSARLERHDRLLSSNLLEAELRAAFTREDVEYRPEVTAPISWIVPDRALSEEIGRVLASGYLRGADCWHLATALFVCDEPSDIEFLTLDTQQRRVARGLGFRV